MGMAANERTSQKKQPNLMDYFDWIDVWVSFGFVIRKQIKNVENDKKKAHI